MVNPADNPAIDPAQQTAEVIVGGLTEATNKALEAEGKPPFPKDPPTPAAAPGAAPTQKQPQQQQKSTKPQQTANPASNIMGVFSELGSMKSDMLAILKATDLDPAVKNGLVREKIGEFITQIGAFFGMKPQNLAGLRSMMNGILDSTLGPAVAVAPQMEQRLKDFNAIVDRAAEGLEGLDPKAAAAQMKKNIEAAVKSGEIQFDTAKYKTPEAFLAHVKGAIDSAYEDGALTGTEKKILAADLERSANPGAHAPVVEPEGYVTELPIFSKTKLEGAEYVTAKNNGKDVTYNLADGGEANKLLDNDGKIEAAVVGFDGNNAVMGDPGKPGLSANEIATQLGGSKVGVQIIKDHEGNAQGAFLFNADKGPENGGIHVFTQSLGGGAKTDMSEALKAPPKVEAAMNYGLGLGMDNNAGGKPSFS